MLASVTDGNWCSRTKLGSEVWKGFLTVCRGILHGKRILIKIKLPERSDWRKVQNQSRKSIVASHVENCTWSRSCWNMIIGYYHKFDKRTGKKTSLFIFSNDEETKPQQQVGSHVSMELWRVSTDHLPMGKSIIASGRVSTQSQKR